MNDSFGSAGSSPLTPLIGRAAEVEAASGLVRRPEVRLVTLTGAGGIGKTRLAWQVAAECRAAFVDGVQFVALALIRDPDLVLPAIARALGLNESGARAAPFDLHAYLGERHILIVLDNFEQVVAAGPHLAELLARCPHLKFLVTSRTRLNVAGEHEYPVGPLALPEGRAAADHTTLAQFASVALFVQRAQAIQPDFWITSANASAITAICLGLDGLPLALELAAKRVKALSVEQLAARLDNTGTLLTGGDRSAAARHQTIEATIEWSYNFLPASQQALFRRLCVFAGGCTLEAAEAVCAGNEIEPVAVLDHLTQLIDQSLVVSAEQHGAMRYRMLEVIRQYGYARLLASGEADRLDRRHRDWCLVLAEQAEPELTGKHQRVWLDRLEAEHDNVRAALHWSLKHQEVEAAARIASAIWPFWLVRGYLSEARKWLDQCLDQLSGTNAVRAKTVMAAGIMAGRLGEGERAVRLLSQSADLYRAIGDHKHLAFALFTFGVGAERQGDYEAARVRYEESLAAARAAADDPGIALALSSLSLIALYQGQLAPARAFGQESLRLNRKTGDVRGTAAILTNLAQIALQEGEIAAAIELSKESLALRRGLGEKGGSAHTLTVLGQAALRQNNLAEAAAYYEESLRLRQELGEAEGVAAALEGFAAIRSAQGAAAPAARLLGAAARLRQTAGQSAPPLEQGLLDRALAATRAELGDQAFAAAFDEGRQFVPDKVHGYQPLLDPAQGPALPEMPQRPTSAYPDDLTAREVEVLRLVAQGLGDRAIAEALVISPRTVQGHVRSIFGKLNLHSRAAATRYAVERHLA